MENTAFCKLHWIPQKTTVLSVLTITVFKRDKICLASSNILKLAFYKINKLADNINNKNISNRKKPCNCFSFVYRFVCNRSNKNEIIASCILWGENIICMLHGKYFASLKKQLKYNKNLKLLPKNWQQRIKPRTRGTKQNKPKELWCKNIMKIYWCAFGNCRTDRRFKDFIPSCCRFIQSIDLILALV